MRRIILIALLALLFTQSCERRLPFEDLPEFVDRLVINANISANEPIAIEVSKMAWAYDGSVPEILNDSLLGGLELKVNNVPLALAYNPSTAKFENDYRAKEKERYDVFAYLDGYNSVSSSQTLPSALLNKKRNKTD